MTRILAFIILILASVAAQASSTPAPPDSAADNTLTASLITCWPGKEVYELYGHTALRIHGREAGGVPFDSVWNYGMFNYSDPNFVGRFVKGELMYHVGGYPFAWFMPEYVMSGRRVEEQVLNLSPEQTMALRKALQTNSLPQNATYLYDYVKDNCSTRVLDRIEDQTGELLVSRHRPTYRTYREAMRAYHRHYPWYSLGIDVALASPIDTVITYRDETFLPVMLHEKLAHAKMPDGRPAVAATHVLNAGIPDATLPPTPWYAAPLFWSWTLLVLTMLYCGICVRRHTLFNWMEAIYFTVIGMAGCVVTFLVFGSIHRAASPNLLLIWLNPLALIVPVLIWSRRTRPVVVAYFIAQAMAIAIAAVIWPFQTQCGNPAFLPLILTELLLTITYSGIYLQNRK